METKNSFSRAEFSRQTAKCLLFDGSVQFSPSACANMIESLENLIILLSHLGGPTRIPLLSLSVVTDVPETLLPIQYVRGNFSRIQSALEELRQIISAAPSVRGTREWSIEEALREICAQFRKHVKVNLKTAGYWCQLEIIVITCQTSANMVHHIEKIVNNIDLEYLKRIQVVSFSTSDYFNNDIPSPSSSDSDSVLSSVTGLVDSLVLDTNQLSIDNYVRSWLHDSATDTEYMCIILPPNKTGDSVSIKCDLTERILHPGLLPYTTAFNMTSGGEPMQMNSRSNNNLPVYQLQVTGVMANSALCDSVVYGMPMIAQPTACWKMEWDELETNAQKFHVLCSQLCDKDQVLICQAFVPLDTTAKLPYLKRTDTHNTAPTAHYVLLPSINGTMLVKSIGVSELTLPCDHCPPADCISDEVKEEISYSLDQVDVLNSYNPLMTKSDLYNTLKSRTKKVQPTKPLRHIPLTQVSNNFACPSAQHPLPVVCMIFNQFK